MAINSSQPLLSPMPAKSQESSDPFLPNSDRHVSLMPHQSVFIDEDMDEDARVGRAKEIARQWQETPIVSWADAGFPESVQKYSPKLRLSVLLRAFKVQAKIRSQRAMAGMLKQSAPTVTEWLHMTQFASDASRRDIAAAIGLTLHTLEVLLGLSTPEEGRHTVTSAEAIAMVLALPQDEFLKDAVPKILDRLQWLAAHTKDAPAPASKKKPLSVRGLLEGQDLDELSENLLGVPSPAQLAKIRDGRRVSLSDWMDIVDVLRGKGVEIDEKEARALQRSHNETAIRSAST